MIPAEDVAWLAQEINAATLDARETTDIPGATLVYSRAAMEWQSKNRPAESMKEWIDEQAGTVMKWPVPVFSVTRSEWLPQVSCDQMVVQTPVHLPDAEEAAILGAIRRGNPVAVFGSPAGGMSAKIAEEVGLRSSDAKPGALVETASVAADDAYTRDIPRQFVILQYATRNQAVNGSRVLYTVAGSPALVVSKKNGRRVMVWDPAELIPDFPWVDKPFVDFIGSPCAYVMVARVLKDFLQGTNSPHVEEIDTAQAVNVGYWKLRDGSYRMLAGNLEEGLRHDADFNRHVTVVFPSSWGQPPVSVHLGQAESRLLRIEITKPQP